MIKSELLGLYRTSFNHIKLTYASLILWCYPETPDYFDAVYDHMQQIPKPFGDLKVLIRDEKSVRIACEELYDSAHRAAVTELFPFTKRYCHDTCQLSELKRQPWFQFWRILRNYFAHDMVFNFSKDEKAILPVSWSGITIDLSMNGKQLLHGQCSREKLRELLETANHYIVESVA